MDENNNRSNEDPKEEKDHFIDEPFLPQQPANGAPAPAKKSSFMTKWFPILLAVFMLVFGFFGGMLYSNLSKSEAGRVMDWMIETIRENSLYYEDLSDAELEEIIAAMGTQGAYYMTGDDYAELLSPNSFYQLLLEMEGMSSGGVAIEIWQDYGADGKPVYANDPAGNLTVLTKNIFVSQVYDYEIPTEDEARDGYIAPTDYSAQKQLKRFDRFVALEIDGEWVDFWNESYSKFWSAFTSFPLNQTFRAKVVRVQDNGDGTADYPRVEGTGEIDTSDQNTVIVELRNENYIPRYVTAYDAESPEMAGVGLPEDVLYLDFKSFMGRSDEQFEQIMQTFRTEGKSKLILDLRYNGGGLLDILETLGSYLVRDPDNPDAANVLVGSQKFRNKSDIEYRTKHNYYADTGITGIVVLANGNTASASEALIGAMDSYGTLTGYVGTKSYGKGIMQQYFYFKQMQISFALKLTTAQLYLPDGRTIHGVGFIPAGTADRETNLKAESRYVPETLYVANGEGASFAADAQLAAALELLAA